MVLQIHSDVSYLNEANAKSTAGGHYFLGKAPDNNKPIFLNGAIHTLCTILKFIASSAAEAELGSLFLNAKKGKEIKYILEALNHKHPPIHIHVDNATTVSIANQSIKRQRSKQMEMRYFLVLDQVSNKHFLIKWYPRQENFGDYVTKHHLAHHHQKVRPYYVHTPDSPQYLIHALPPSVI